MSLELWIGMIVAALGTYLIRLLPLLWISLWISLLRFAPEREASAAGNRSAAAADCGRESLFLSCQTIRPVQTLF